MNKGIIYCATSPNGKKYIGLSTKTLDQRKSQHLSTLLKERRNIYFYNALRKHGFDNFRWILLDEISSESKNDLVGELKILESLYISKYNTSNKNFGYNLTLGGDVGPNEETIEKIRKINTEKWKDLGYRKKQQKNWKNKEFILRFKSIMQELSDINSKKIKEKWRDPTYRTKLVRIRNAKDYIKVQRDNALRQWQDPEIREKSMKSFREKIWNNEERNKKISESLKKRARDRKENI
jgi:hypothetical protein